MSRKSTYETYRFNDFNLLVISILNPILYKSTIFNNLSSNIQQKVCIQFQGKNAYAGIHLPLSSSH
jgi:hypothetical protein